MGAVLVGDKSDCEYVLLGGNPVGVIKSISRESTYFLQKQLFHPHMVK